MPSSALIIGYGSIGQRHASILKKKFKFKKIFILTKRRIKGFLVIKNILEIRKLNIDYIIISSPTFNHFKHLKFIEKNLKYKKILVEKPLFEKFKNLKIKKNKVFVGYNNDWLQQENVEGIQVVRVKTYIAANEGFLHRVIDFISFMLMGSIAGIFTKKPDI